MKASAFPADNIHTELRARFDDYLSGSGGLLTRIMSSESNKPSTEYLQNTLDEADNATHFKPKDAPNELRADDYENLRFWYKRLKSQNEGKNGVWRDQREVTKDLNNKIIKSVATQLDLTTRQKEQAKGHMSRVNCQKYSKVGGLNMVAMCICQIIIRNDERDKRSFHPLAKPENNNRLFNKLFNEFGFKPQQMSDTIQKLRYDLGI